MLCAVVPSVLTHMLRIYRVPSALCLTPARIAQLAERRARQVPDLACDCVEVGAVEIEAQQQAVRRAPAAGKGCGRRSAACICQDSLSKVSLPLC